MIADLFRWIAGGIIAPQRTVEWLLSLRLRFMDAVLVLTLAYLIGEIALLVLGVGQSPDGSSFVEVHLLGFGLSIMVMFLVSLTVFVIGQVFGGTATFEQCCVVISWHTLVVSVLTPLIELGALELSLVAERAAAQAPPSDPHGGVMAGFLIAIGISFWLMARYITEVHRFQSTMVVMAGMVGTTLMIAVFIAGMSGG